MRKLIYFKLLINLLFREALFGNIVSTIMKYNNTFIFNFTLFNLCLSLTSYIKQNHAALLTFS